MNPYLSELFGQGGYSEEDLEKMAAYDLLTKIADDEGWDPDQLTDEEVEYLLAELASAPGEGLTEEEKLAEVQAAEAYHMGQVMAHGYWDETEKLAGGEPGRIRQAGRYLLRPTTKAHGGGAGRYERLRTAAREGFRSAEKGGVEGKMNRLKAMGRMAAHVSPEVAAAGALGAGGVAGYKALKKEAEDFEALAEERAEEMLAEAGSDDEGYEIDVDDVADYIAEEYGIDPTTVDEDDFMGAAQELDALVKEAEGGVKDKARAAGARIKDYTVRGAKAINPVTGARELFQKGEKGSRLLLKSRAIGAARMLPAAAGASALGYGGYKGVQALRKKAEIEELDEAINDRAVEMLYEAGYIE